MKKMFGLILMLGLLTEASVFARADTDLQSQIDAASAAGGGTVRVEAGDHPITSIFLRDNVTLELAKGARLYACSTNRDDYMDAVLQVKGDSTVRKWKDCCTAVICGNGATNIAIVGEGTIDGCGDRLQEKLQTPGRYRDILLYRCKGIRIEGVSIVNSARWTCYLKECEDVVIRRVKVRSLGCWNNDGIDLEAKHVLIEDCDIEADDDAVCLKTFNPDFICEDIEVRNCRIASNCDHVKIGTESFGGFRDIRVHHCEFAKCATNIITQIKNASGSNNGIPGWNPSEIVSRCGLAIECVDGGFIDGVTVSHIKMNRSAQTPIFVRLGARRSNLHGRTPYLKNVTIEDLTGEAASQIANSVTGVPGLRPENIVIRNVKLRQMGGVRAEEAARPVPEAARGYPENRMFGRHPLPGYGFYVRHVDGIVFENVELTVDRPDSRPDIVASDTRGLVRR